MPLIHCFSKPKVSFFENAKIHLKALIYKFFFIEKSFWRLKEIERD
jgi:hypothetical protein